MGYRYDEFAPGEIYHVITRSVERRKIFSYDNDRKRFLMLMHHCLPSGRIVSFSNALKLKQEPSITSSGEGLVDLLCYCLMDNHIHLLLLENKDGGTSLYMQRLLNSYAKYFNTSRKRVGSLFINPFKAVLVDEDEQFLHVSRYIHLNPYVAHMVKDPLLYVWSSLNEYISQERKKMCHRSLLKSMMRSKEYQRFVCDDADYFQTLAEIKHLLIDYDD